MVFPEEQRRVVAGVGRRKDMIHWAECHEDGSTRPMREPCTAALTLAYRMTGDAVYAARALDTAGRKLAMARRVLRGGREHADMGGAVCSVAAGHGRNWGAGAVTGCYGPLLLGTCDWMGALTPRIELDDAPAGLLSLVSDGAVRFYNGSGDGPRLPLAPDGDRPVARPQTRRRLGDDRPALLTARRWAARSSRQVASSGPAGPGSPSRFVEVDGELNLAVHGQTGPVPSSEPFGGSPIASGVAPEVVGVEHRCGHNSRPMMRIDGTMTAASNHVLTARTHPSATAGSRSTRGQPTAFSARRRGPIQAGTGTSATRSARTCGTGATSAWPCAAAAPAPGTVRRCPPAAW